MASQSKKGNPAQKPLDFQEILNNAKKNFEGLAKEIEDQARKSESQNREEMARVLKKHNECVIQNLNESIKKLEQQIKNNPELKTALEKLKVTFTQEAEKLKKNNTELLATSETLGTSLQETWVSLTKEVEKAYKDFMKAGGKKEDLERCFETLFDKLNTGGQELDKKMEEINNNNKKK